MRGWRERAAQHVRASSPGWAWALVTGPSPRCTRGWMRCCSVDGRKSGMALRSFGRAPPRPCMRSFNASALSTAFPQRWAVAWRACTCGGRAGVSCSTRFERCPETSGREQRCAPLTLPVSPTIAGVSMHACLPRSTSSPRDPAAPHLQPSFSAWDAMRCTGRHTVHVPAMCMAWSRRCCVDCGATAAGRSRRAWVSSGPLDDAGEPGSGECGRATRR
jgi:hypothetical protein